MKTIQNTLEPIGTLKSRIKYRYEAPRQGVLAGESESFIRLNSGMNFTEALKGLDGFSRIWVIYGFHLNQNWKPLVTPPRNDGKKIGVFATRAPYRPNQIGLSCVKLLRIDKLKIYISESDILDGSPVYDIKPYLPYSDSFPDSETGWVKTNPEESYNVVFVDAAAKQTEWLWKKGGANLDNYSRVQLSFNPRDVKRKRIKKAESGESQFVLAYRTWRILYDVDDEKREVSVLKIFSGYSPGELREAGNDKYQDKILHSDFVKKFK